MHKVTGAVSVLLLFVFSIASYGENSLKQVQKKEQKHTKKIKQNEFDRTLKALKAIEDLAESEGQKKTEQDELDGTLKALQKAFENLADSPTDNLKFREQVKVWRDSPYKIPNIVDQYKGNPAKDLIADYNNEILLMTRNPTADVHKEVGFWSNALSELAHVEDAARMIIEGKLSKRYIQALLARHSKNQMFELLESALKRDLHTTLVDQVQASVPKEFNLCTTKKEARRRMNIAVGVIAPKIAKNYNTFVNVHNFGLRGLLYPVPKSLDATYRAGANAFAFDTVLDTIRNRCSDLRDEFGDPPVANNFNDERQAPQFQPPPQLPKFGFPVPYDPVRQKLQSLEQQRKGMNGYEKFGKRFGIPPSQTQPKARAIPRHSGAPNSKR